MKDFKDYYFANLKNRFLITIKCIYRYNFIGILIY